MDDLISRQAEENLIENTASGIGKSETYNQPKMVGWICPVCGRGLSPFTAVCPCKNDGKGWEVTFDGRSGR